MSGERTPPVEAPIEVEQVERVRLPPAMQEKEPKKIQIKLCLGCSVSKRNTPRKANIAMGNSPFEDVFPIENGGFHCYVSLPEGNCFLFLFLLALKFLRAPTDISWVPI